jgi:hypothetical protein
VNKIDLAIEELHRSENDIAVELQQIAERHHADASVFHLGHNLARWSQDHVRALAEIGTRYGLDLDPEPESVNAVTAAVREAVGDLVARRKEPAMLLLADMRRLHKMTAGASVDWDTLGQAAQALQDRELLALTERCHPQTERQEKWAKTVIKEISAQALVT